MVTTVERAEKTTARKTASKKEATAPKRLEAKVYNMEGKEVDRIALPERIFNVRWNPDLVHQVAVAQSANARGPVAHTKGRGDVRGGGRKPWRQKGTGRARHGSIRSPLWRGGGVTFGPTKERNFERKVNKKMRRKALFSSLSKKLEDNELLFIDDVCFESPSAKEGKKVLKNLSAIKGFEAILSKRKNSAIIGLPERHMPTERSFSNFGNIAVEEWRNLNPVKILSSKYLVISHPKEAISFFERKAAKGREVVG
jgi:large subunit ribosomal protein L4